MPWLVVGTDVAVVVSGVCLGGTMDVITTYAITMTIYKGLSVLRVFIVRRSCRRGVSFADGVGSPPYLDEFVGIQFVSVSAVGQLSI